MYWDHVHEQNEIAGMALKLPSSEEQRFQNQVIETEKRGTAVSQLYGKNQKKVKKSRSTVKQSAFCNGVVGGQRGQRRVGGGCHAIGKYRKWKNTTSLNWAGLLSPAPTMTRTTLVEMALIFKLQSNNGLYKLPICAAASPLFLMQ